MNLLKHIVHRPGRLPLGALALLLSSGSMTLKADTVDERLKEPAAVLKEVMDAPDKGIPEDLLNSAY